MKWIIDSNILESLSKSEILFHKVFPFFQEQEKIFTFNKNPNLTQHQKDFLGTHFLEKDPISIASQDFDLDELVENLFLSNSSVKIVNDILYSGILKRASDIHFESYEHFGRVRFRIDGELNFYDDISLEIWRVVINRVKVLAKLRLDDQKHPQMGRKSMFYGSREVDLRFSSHPTVFGESVVIRILDKNLQPLRITDLGFHESFQKQLLALLKIPYGLIIFTGPTGSGKTTTLFSLLSKINTSNVNIMTLEDPIEYILKGAKQTEIKDGTIEKFADGIRSILRQDPDIILVGEMRDEETANMAFRAAMTGHIVFSTLHANSVFQVIQRLEDLGVNPSLISGNLRGIISQRLVKKKCLICKGKGEICCQKKGYLGRLPLGEILILDKNIDELISQKAGISIIENYAKKCSFKNFQEYGQFLVDQDIVDIEEMEKLL